MYNVGGEMNGIHARAGPCCRACCADFCRFSSVFRALELGCGSEPLSFRKLPGDGALRRGSSP
jgi:hypothetical protein